jgi:purine nucleosidase
MPPDASKRAIIIISDPQPLGDDGAALALLFASRAAARVTLVAASGNVWADEACANLRDIVRRFGRADVPVLAGLSPARHRTRLRYFQERKNRRADLRFAGALRMTPPDSTEAHDNDVLNAFIETIEASEKPDILLLAPATLLQAALERRAGLDTRVNRVFAMGGAISVPGNTTAQAEFNFWFDPEAADALLASNLPLTLLPLDALDGLTYPRDMAAKARAPEASYVREYAAKRKGADTPMWDEALIAAYLWPALIRDCADLRLGVVTAQGADYGASRGSNDAARRPVQTITALDREALGAHFTQLLAEA